MNTNRIGIIADIHAVPAALQKALAILQLEQVDKIMVAGDIVGYQKYANECCDLLRPLANVIVVAGNHDRAVVGKANYLHFTPKAIQAIHETMALITAENKAWLASLPIVIREDEMELTHASFHQPHEWHYLTKLTPPEDIQMNFSVLDGRIGFVGHTHVPVLFRQDENNRIEIIEPGESLYSLKGYRAIINVGSVGRPRTQAGESCLVIYDRTAQTLHFKRFRF